MNDFHNREPARVRLPYGVNDLDTTIVRNKVTGQIKCVVKGCDNWLTPPCRNPKHRGSVCPQHGVRVHQGGTYSYEDYKRNLMVDSQWFDQHIRRNPFKYEAHRFGQERSEDAVTWNVFRSFQRASLLHKIVKLCTGLTIEEEPKLYLWGLELKANSAEPWDLLLKARERFESDLPVSRPKTEPDIALVLPNQYTLLVEAKFTSINGTYERDKKTKLFDLTIDQLVQIYHDKALKILDYECARKKDRLHYQLWRNLTFAEFMAAQDGEKTQAFHANLVRAGFEEGICEEFLSVVRPEYHDRFEQCTWEEIYYIAQQHRNVMGDLCRYMEMKTERLKPAFKLDNRKESDSAP